MDRFGRITTTAETADCRHTRIIPAVYQAFFHQCQQVTLTHQCIAKIQFIEFRLTGTMVVQVFPFFQPVDKEIVKRAVHNELERTQGMGNSFEEVTLSVGEVVHRIGFPCGACAVVRVFYHTIDDRIAEVHIGISHVNLCTEHHSAFFDFTAIHLFEKFEAFFDRTIPVRTFHTRLGRSSFLLCNLFGSLLIDICFSFLYKADSEVP